MRAILRPFPASPGELRQEPQIVLEEQADVVDAVLEHGDAIDPEAEREPGVALRVVPHLLEDGGVDHAGSPHLDIAGSLATAAARARAEDARDVVFRAGLHEREVGWAQPDLDGGPEHPAAEVRQG